MVTDASPRCYAGKVVHRGGLELLADEVARAKWLGGGCRQMGSARRVTGTAADAGKGALVFGLSLESAARCLAASVRQV